jgi:hypothetical protein
MSGQQNRFVDEGAKFARVISPPDAKPVDFETMPTEDADEAPVGDEDELTLEEKAARKQ